VERRRVFCIAAQVIRVLKDMPVSVWQSNSQAIGFDNGARKGQTGAAVSGGPVQVLVSFGHFPGRC